MATELPFAGDRLLLGWVTLVGGACLSPSCTLSHLCPHLKTNVHSILPMSPGGTALEGALR